MRSSRKYRILKRVYTPYIIRTFTICVGGVLLYMCLVLIFMSQDEISVTYDYLWAIEVMVYIILMALLVYFRPKWVKKSREFQKNPKIW